MEGIGDNITIEFVDPTGTGEYHMTMDPGEKDALAKVPGAGLSMLEAMGLSTQATRFNRTDGSTAPMCWTNNGRSGELRQPRMNSPASNNLPKCRRRRR